MRWKICMKPSASYVDFMMRSSVWQPLQLSRKRFCSSVPGMLIIHSALVRCAERFFTFLSLMSALAKLPAATSAARGSSIS